MLPAVLAVLHVKAERAAAPPKHIDRPLLTPYSHSCKLVGFAAVLFGAETQRSAAGDHRGGPLVQQVQRRGTAADRGRVLLLCAQGS